MERIGMGFQEEKKQKVRKFMKDKKELKKVYKIKNEKVAKKMYAQ